MPSVRHRSTCSSMCLLAACGGAPGRRHRLTLGCCRSLLDPACGSGTFLFHAVRKYIGAAEKQAVAIDKTLVDVTRHVVGMDLHPVAVTLARVTYLLAIGHDKLTDPNRGNIQIPVYLGDSIQWRQQKVDLWSAGNLVIHTDDQKTLFEGDLSFPDAILDDAAQFDQLVNELADYSARRKSKSPPPSLKALFARFHIPSEFQPTIESTFKVMCRLHDEGRDHIWGYYVRSFVSPVCPTSRAIRFSGMTPTASPPARSTASAMIPINPTLPPP